MTDPRHDAYRRAKQMLANGNVEAVEPTSPVQRMASVWRPPEATVYAAFAGGLRAAILSTDAAQNSVPASNNHVVAHITKPVRINGISPENSILNHRGSAPSGLSRITPAGARPCVFPRMQVLHVYIPAAYLDTHARCLATTLEPSAIELIDPVSHPDPVLDFALDQIASVLPAYTAIDRLWLDSLGRALVARILQRWSSLASWSVNTSFCSKGGLAPWQLKRVCDRMRADLAQQPALAELAQLVNLSAAHFCRAFRRSMGLPPHRWLAQVRMERAKALLRDPALSLTVVGQMLGYSGQSAFGAAFRRALGAAPSVWRKSHETG